MIEPAAAWSVANVLIGTPPPENAAGGRIAFKTGTSYGYRDAWAIGFDGRRTIGVWVGRPDGAPVVGLTGRTAAAPILFDAFARSGVGLQPLPPAPKGVLIASTAKLPPPLRRFQSAGNLGEIAAAESAHRLSAQRREPRIIGKRRRSARSDRHQDRRRHASPQRAPQRHAAAAKKSARTLFFAPDGPGFVRLTVTDATGAADSVVVRLQ